MSLVRKESVHLRLYKENSVAKHNWMLNLPRLLHFLMESPRMLLARESFSSLPVVLVYRWRRILYGASKISLLGVEDPRVLSRI